MAEGKRITDVLAEYEAEHEFARQILPPVEDQVPWYGPEPGYRWFRSTNVIDLEKYRWLKLRGRL